MKKVKKKGGKLKWIVLAVLVIIIGSAAMGGSETDTGDKDQAKTTSTKIDSSTEETTVIDKAKEETEQEADEETKRQEELAQQQKEQEEALAAQQQAQEETASQEKNTQQANEDPIVYITNTGSKYHRSSCRTLKKSQIEKHLSEVQGSYEPCGICNPPQ